MKKQTFYKQKKLKSQKSLEYINHNSFNFQEYSQNHNITEKNDFRNNISLDNLENSNINNNINNLKRINNTIKLEKYGKLGELNYEIEPKNIILIPDSFNGDINSLKLELLPREKYFFISGKNFQLLIDTLNEKERMIKELEALLNKYKNQKNNELNYKINKINENKQEIYLLKEENKKLKKANNELMQQIEKKDIYLNKIQKDKNKEKESINSNLEKEIDFLKKDKESLLKMINQIKTDLNNNKEENEKKIKQMSLNFERIKIEKEKIEKIYYENKIKESEQNLNLLYKEIEELKNKNNILLKRNNSEKNKTKENSIFKNLIIEKANKIIIRSEKFNEVKMNEFNKLKRNDELVTDYQYKNFDNNNNISQLNENSYDKINIQNLDMLMLLYNKSKQIEKYINNELDEKNNEL